MKNYFFAILISPLFALFGVVIANMVILQSVTLETILVFAFVSYVSMGVIGIPSLLLMNHKNWQQWWQYSLVGITLGLLTLMIWLLPMAFDNFYECLKFITSKENIILPSSAAVAGFMGALSFWYISIRPKIYGKT